MPELGRLGDHARNPADGHGCLSCAHDVRGPAIAGSTDVFCNSKNALRVGDPGTHSSCCGPNTWNAAKGAPGVYINNIKAHRKTDETVHCGGKGTLIEGSDDVYVGDFGGGPAGVPPKGKLEFRMVTPEGHPIPNLEFTIAFPGGGSEKAKTDGDGWFRKPDVPLGCAIVDFDDKFRVLGQDTKE